MFSSPTLFGNSMDEILSYNTVKVVWIRDRWIGLVYYTLVFLVLMWVFFGQILWRNEHFFKKDVTGLARMFHSYPTLGNCDPLQEPCARDRRDLSTLSYCDAYDGDLGGSQQAHCKYETSPLVRPGGEPDSKLFIPTSVEVMVERTDCKSGVENCTNEYVVERGSDCLHDKYLCRTRGAEKDQYYYVADVTNDRIRFTSSYERDSIRGTSLMHPAFVGTCHGRARLSNTTRSWTERKGSQNQGAECHPAVRDWSLHKIPCARDFGVDCGKMRTFDAFANHSIGQDFNAFFDALIHTRQTLLDEGRTEANIRHNGSSAAHSFIQERAKLSRSVAKELGAPDSLEAPAFRSQFSDPWGDVFTLGRLLQMAGTDLDKDYNLDGWTTRQAGTALEVRVVYNNLYRLVSTFGYEPVEYHYEVNELLLPYMSRTLELEPLSSDPTMRRYEVQYGVLVDFKVSGQFGFFDLTYLILMITSALALAASATTVTDIFAMYLYPARENFFHLKYEVSPDFSKAWKCSQCGYLNDPEHVHCQRVPKWHCSETTPPCGAARDGLQEADSDIKDSR